MPYKSFSDEWKKFIKHTHIKVSTLIDDDKFEMLCYEYIHDCDVDVNVIEQLEKDRELQLAQLSD